MKICDYGCGKEVIIMKIRKMIEILTENYDEQQFVLERFPNAWWSVLDSNNTKFFVPENKINYVLESMRIWKEQRKQ